ncbi:MAG: hypothetical protein ACYTGH_14120 [Planctomycetota bacterium]|jgi:hypothetical protein
MVVGLDVFRKHFAGLSDRYVLIGGTACEIAMNDVGLPFRATKDLDVVLCVESLDQEFVERFWDFVRAGEYHSQCRHGGKQQYYRFLTPETAGYPAMLELFAREPDMLTLSDGAHLTPLPLDEPVSSLSAILLDDDYYHFLLTGRQERDGISFAGPDRLIPFKASAWLDLAARRMNGEQVDGRDIKKHRNDVFRLYQILPPAVEGEVPEAVKNDLARFLDRMDEEAIDFKALKLGRLTLSSVVADLRKIYRCD